MIRFSRFIAEALRPISGPLGGNYGGIHVDDAGQKHYVKWPDDPQQAHAEVLASRISQHMGIKTLSPEVKQVGGRTAVVTKWQSDLETRPKKHFENLSKDQHHELGKIYHAAILTNNRDVVGLEHDNILHHKETGEIHSIDQGGAFHFRAQGGHKDYDDSLEIRDGLMKSSRPSGHVFGHAFSKTPSALRTGLQAVKNLDDHTIHKEFKQSGLTNWQELHSNFMARKKALLDGH